MYSVSELEALLDDVSADMEPAHAKTLVSDVVSDLEAMKSSGQFYAQLSVALSRILRNVFAMSPVAALHGLEYHLDCLCEYGSWMIDCSLCELSVQVFIQAIHNLLNQSDVFNSVLLKKRNQTPILDLTTKLSLYTYNHLTSKTVNMTAIFLTHLLGLDEVNTLRLTDLWFSASFYHLLQAVLENAHCLSDECLIFIQKCLACELDINPLVRFSWFKESETIQRSMSDVLAASQCGNISTWLWRQMVEEFKQYASQILMKFKEEGGGLEHGAFMFFSMLGVLCEAISNDADAVTVVKDDAALLKTVIDLMHCARLASLTPGSVFTPDKDLLTHPNLDVIAHPAFAFKANLVRFLGNAAWQHPANQSLIVKEGAFADIVNNLGVDDKNPYIQQWGVIAIRNICEGNDEAKRFLRDLQPQQVSEQTESLLRSHGLGAQVVNGQCQVFKLQ